MCHCCGIWDGRTELPSARAAAARTGTDDLLKIRARVALIAAAITLPGLLALAGPATAAAGSQRHPAAPAVQHPDVALHPNVAEPHAPQVQRLLASRSARILAARAAAGAAPPAGASAVQGVDVSSVQHGPSVGINWSQVAGAGYKFAFVKAAEGNYYLNSYAAADLAQASAAGLYAAPYDFGIPNVSGGALQADYALDHSALAPAAQSLPMILDIEYDPNTNSDHANECYNLTPAQTVSWIGAWVAEYTRRTGQHPAIYTTADWWAKCTGQSTAFAAYPLWIAGDTSSGPLQPIMPPAWKTWTYWQYGTNLVPGISGQVDVSYLSATALQVLAPPAQTDATGTAVSLPVGALTAQTASYSATGLPTGLSISPATGLITGTLPGGAAAFPARVTVTPTTGSPVTQAFTWDVHGPVSLKQGSRSGSAGSPVSVQVTAADSLPGCTLRLTASGLPPGLSMTSCGKIIGWPRAFGQYEVHVSASDSAGPVATAAFGWRVYGARAAGPAGVIRLNRYRCLAEGAGSTIVVGRCGTRAPKWTVVADGTLRLKGNCLAQVARFTRISSCSHGAVHWQLGGGNGKLTSGLANIATGQCLTDVGVRVGGRVGIGPCDHQALEQWLLPSGPIASGVPGYCLSDDHARGPVTQQVNVRWCKPSAQQTWTVQPTGQVQSGKYCLSLASGIAQAGRPVVLSTCGQAASQKWELYGGPTGVWLVNAAAGLCLADPGDRAKSGTGLVLGDCQLSDPGITWRVS
jgi:GH25 family lysozyme M1 (1,4-beta-N-acetylmuramidase)